MTGTQMLEIDSLVISERFRDLLPLPPQDTFDMLVQSIETEGIREPLVIVANKRVLVDGHRRLEAAKKLGLKSVPTVAYRFESDEAVEEFIFVTQAQRRNAPEVVAYVRGKHYEKAKGNSLDNLKKGQDSPKPQNEVSGKVASKVAEQHGVSRATVERDAQFASAVDAISREEPEAKAEILSGKSGLTKEQVTKAGKSKSPKAAIAEAKKENAAKRAKKKAGGSKQVTDLIKSILRDMDKLKKMLEEPGVFVGDCDRERSLSRLSMNREGFLLIMRNTIVEN